jgi:hypothetical protein
MHGSAPRLRRVAGATALVVAVLTAAGCTEAVSGRAQLGPPPPATAAGATYLALLDLAGAGALHYTGSVSAPGLQDVDLDIDVTSGGAGSGRASYRGHSASMLLVDRATYLRAGQDYWTTVGQSKDLARRYANRWVKAQRAAFGVDLGTLLAPTTLVTELRRGLGRLRGRHVADLPAATVHGGAAVKVDADGVSYYLSADQPYRLLRLETPDHPRLVPPGPSSPDLTGVGLDVSDVTAGEAAVYQRLRQQAGQLGRPIDGQVRLVQGSQGFTACGPARCTLRVTFSNASDHPVRAELHADWTGDGSPLGGCDNTAGTVAAHRVGTASCTISSPGWVAFYFKASSTPGTHPYVAMWTVVALAPPPDLRQLYQQAAAAACTSGGCAARADTGHDAAVRAGYQMLRSAFRGGQVYGAVPGYRAGPGPDPTERAGLPDLIVDLGSRVYLYHVGAEADAAAARAAVRGFLDGLRRDVFDPEVAVRYGPPIGSLTAHDPLTGGGVRVFSRGDSPGVLLYTAGG